MFVCVFFLYFESYKLTHIHTKTTTFVYFYIIANKFFFGLNWHTYTQKQQLLYQNRKKIMVPTARGVPRRSPIQVLTAPDVAWLQWSDENWYVQRGMAVDTDMSSFLTICLTWNLGLKLSSPVRFRTLHPLYKPLYITLYFFSTFRYKWRVNTRIFINRNNKNMHLFDKYWLTIQSTFLEGLAEWQKMCWVSTFSFRDSEKALLSPYDPKRANRAKNDAKRCEIHFTF